MDYLKTTLRVSVLVVVVAAFVEIPYGAAIIAVLGLAIGVQRNTSDMVRTFILAIGLSITAGALGAIPAVGGYISAIMGGAAALAAASSLGVLASGFGKKRVCKVFSVNPPGHCVSEISSFSVDGLALICVLSA